jgi:hypothetical protein
VQLVGSGGCNSAWYWTHWGYYWGGFWRTVPVVSSSATLVGGYACGRWDVVLAFAFIGGFFWLLSAALVCLPLSKCLGAQRADQVCARVCTIVSSGGVTVIHPKWVVQKCPKPGIFSVHIMLMSAFLGPTLPHGRWFRKPSTLTQKIVS